MKDGVLFIGNFLSASGGSRTVCEELALRLDANGMNVITASSKVARLPRLYDMLETAWSRRAEYQVAHVEVFSGPAFVWAEAVCALLRFLKKPYVLALHGGNLPNFARRNAQRVQRLLTSANVVVAPSAYLRDALAVYCEQVRLMPNALEIARYPFRLRQSLRPRLVWLRAFHEIYNPMLAPRVVARIAEEFPDLFLTMVGPDKHDGSLEETKQVAAQLGVNVCLPGGVSKQEVPAWLNRGDIFLNTSSIDNTPVSVIEAMACGLCVVSTNVGGMPLLVKDGEDALLVPPNDVNAMAAAVNRLLNDEQLAAKLSRHARAKVENYDWSVVLPEWHRLFSASARRATLT